MAIMNLRDEATRSPRNNRSHSVATFDRNRTMRSPDVPELRDDFEGLSISSEIHFPFLTSTSNRDVRVIEQHLQHFQLQAPPNGRDPGKEGSPVWQRRSRIAPEMSLLPLTPTTGTRSPMGSYPIGSYDNAARGSYPIGSYGNATRGSYPVGSYGNAARGSYPVGSFVNTAGGSYPAVPSDAARAEMHDSFYSLQMPQMSSQTTCLARSTLETINSGEYS